MQTPPNCNYTRLKFLKILPLLCREISWKCSYSQWITIKQLFSVWTSIKSAKCFCSVTTDNPASRNPSSNDEGAWNWHNENYTGCFIRQWIKRERENGRASGTATASLLFDLLMTGLVFNLNTLHSEFKSGCMCATMAELLSNSATKHKTKKGCLSFKCIFLKVARCRNERQLRLIARCLSESPWAAPAHHSYE